MALGPPPGGSSPERGDVGGQRPGVLLHQVLIAERSVARISWQDAGPTRRRPLTAARSAGPPLARAVVMAPLRSSM